MSSKSDTIFFHHIAVLICIHINTSILFPFFSSSQWSKAKWAAVVLSDWQDFTQFPWLRGQVLQQNKAPTDCLPCCSHTWRQHRRQPIDTNRGSRQGLTCFLHACQHSRCTLLLPACNKCYHRHIFKSTLQLVFQKMSKITERLLILISHNHILFRPP